MHSRKDIVMAADVELLISYFALSGDVFPLGPTEISPFPFKDRVEAAARAGFKGFGLHSEDVVHVRDQIGYREMRRVVEANGIKHLEIEFLTNWFRRDEKRQESDKVRKLMLEVAAELGLKDIKVGPGFEDAPADVPLMADELGKLCDEAAPYGTDIVLEIMPWSNVRTIEAGLAIVSGANRNNGGLLIDIWHMARGNIPYSEIRKIPARFIKAVEIDDALKVAPVPDIWEDTIAYRELCGEGELDVPAFLREVQAAGYRGVYGTEILSAKHRKLGLDEMAERVFRSSMAQFADL
ncbi:sugar phosphate isomerase/epimerase family protein [Mesorhizobium muleiense]|uniref:Sugar phosphate isomerase/epimerase n=1 Tax=Mesorhizobium muleiense TaxID=1004279 RepID=A0A1G9KNC5_9HYPH|nr:sugar phosphate isomerase/epimerase family protein [Mesorhizobium muleiense]MCF6101946.1 sugar phosphate isomerase/epimerase [Mesorhizobium muleiense]SDL50905.1 Sugar phosphate isomerase/epimerase [Mesorhizobium muleiense]